MHSLQSLISVTILMTKGNKLRVANLSPFPRFNVNTFLMKQLKRLPWWNFFISFKVCVFKLNTKQIEVLLYLLDFVH